MPDLSPLPRLRPTPSFVPDPARFDRTVHLAHRRRAVRTSLPLGAAVALAVALSVGTSGAGAPSGLNVAGRPSGGPLPTPWVSESVGPDGAGVAAGLGESPSAPPSPSATAPDSADPETSAPDGASPAPDRPWYAATTEVVPFDVATPCQTSTYDATAGWCSRSRTPTTMSSGTEVTLVLEVCRATGDGTLSFPADEAEVYFFVDHGTSDPSDFDGGWTSRPGAHDVTVASGTCLRWNAPWRVADTDGTPLRAGTYSAQWFDAGRISAHGGVGTDPEQSGTFTFTVD